MALVDSLRGNKSENTTYITAPRLVSSLNQKDVPKALFNMCKLKRAGSKNHARDKLLTSGCKGIAPDIYELDRNIFDLTFHDKHLIYINK